VPHTRLQKQELLVFLFINRQSNTINHYQVEKMKLNKLMILALVCVGLLALLSLADAHG
jgi:hypothetical protein